VSFPVPAAALLSLAAAAAPPAVPSAVGEWDSPIGRMKIEAQGAVYKGTLVTPSLLCPFRIGDEVLRGTLVDDSLAGQLRVCLTGRGCADDEWATALLLVGADRLSGAVHVRGKGCRPPFGKKGGLALTRAEGDTPDSQRPEVEIAPSPVAQAPTAPPRAATPSTRSGRPTKAGKREEVRALLKDGAAWLGEGAFEKGRERFLAAIDLDPSVPEAYNGVGVTYRMRNDLPRALEWYKKALAIDPDFGDAYYNMACVYALKGDRTLALRYLQIAAMNGYASAEGIDGDPDLASLRGTREYRALRDRM
jgi:hypothetical protein